MTFNKKYAIRKLAIGVASVAIGISFIEGNVQAAPNSNIVVSSTTSSESYVLSNSDETPALHTWLKDKITQIDFDSLTKDEFYGLVASDNKTYGDIRKVVSDWKEAKLPSGTYSIKKLTIVNISEDERKANQTVEENPLGFEDGVFGYGDLNDIPLAKVEKIVDKENNKEIKPLFYSTDSISGDDLSKPVFYTPEELAEKYKNRNPEYDFDKSVLYKGEVEIPYGNRTLKISYLFNRKNEIGTKTKIEFLEDKIKVIKKTLILKNKEVDEHNNVQNYEVKEQNYQLDKEPSKIVKETPDMVIDEDPGILHAIPETQQANEQIKQLQAKKTGYVFKVKSYEEDGTTSYRYFRTWTTYNGQVYGTTIPYDDSSKIKTFTNVTYSNDDTLLYNHIKPLAPIAIEKDNNVTYMRWEEVAPEGNQTLSYKPVLEDDGTGKAVTFHDYPETPKDRIDYTIIDYTIGTKPDINKEVVEQRKTKYVANENLDVPEKVVNEGKDKIKVSTTIYKLVKTNGLVEDVNGLFENNSTTEK